MRLVVENLGPLREAEVDLTHPFTVFAGPNNSGKTWLATVIYALGSGAVVNAGPAANTMLSQLVAAGPAGVPLSEFRAFLAEAVAYHVAVTRQGLARSFAANASLFQSTKLRVDDLGLKEDVNVGIRRGNFAATVSTSGERVVLLPEPVNGFDGSTEAAVGELRRVQKIALNIAVADWTDLIVPTRFLPAERAAIFLFSRELAAQRMELVDEALAAGEGGEQLLASRASPYPLPIRDALSAAVRTPGFRDRTTEFAPLVDQLERDVLGGALQLNEDGDVRFVSFAAGRPDLGLHHSASLVKSLASLALYVRHEARRGHLLIVDEPELNLHPDNQRRVARFLARVARAGVRVLISTHSDYILRELSNLVTLGAAGADGKARAAKLGYPSDALLSPSDLGVYFFHDGTAERLPVGGDGFSVASIEAEIRSLDIDTQRILFPADDA